MVSVLVSLLRRDLIVVLGLIYSLDSAGVIIDAFIVLDSIGVIVDAFVIEAFFLLALLEICSYISSFRVQSFSASSGYRY
jgi:hypothetical protein